MGNLWLYISIAAFAIAGLYFIIGWRVAAKHYGFDKLKKFLAEYELLTIPIFLVLAIFSFKIIETVFNPPSAINAPPNYETYHYLFRTCLIYVMLLALKWRWFKSDSPKSVERMKGGYIRTESEDPEEIRKDRNRELIYANVKWFAYLYLFAFILRGVFP